MLNDDESVSDDDLKAVVAQIRAEEMANEATQKKIAPFSRAWHIINAVKFLSPESLAREPELVATKWPEYRHLSPQHANILFAEEYNQALKAFYRRDVDALTLAKVRGLDLVAIQWPKQKMGNRAKGGTLTSINAARQFADSIGFRYREFLCFCFEFASKRPRSNFLARPNQLIPKDGKRREVFDQMLAAQAEVLKKEGSLAFKPKVDLTRAPGCFGVPGARHKSSIFCQKCEVAEKCRLVSIQIELRLNKDEIVTGIPQSFDEKRVESKKADKARRAKHMREVRAQKKLALQASSMC